MQDARAEANDRAQMTCLSDSTNVPNSQQSQQTPGTPAKSKAKDGKKLSPMPVEQQFGSFS